MDIELTKRIICPMCRNELQWNVTEKSSDKVIEGYAECKQCGEIYPVRKGIAVFLPAKWQNMKIWERSERIAMPKRGIEQECVQLKNENIDQPSEVLQMIRRRNSQGEVRNEDLYHRYMEVVGMPDTLHKLCCLARKCANEIDDTEYVLDFASGKGLLADALNESGNSHIIVSDINPLIVMQAQREFEKYSNCEKMSFMVFDIKKSPFRDKSINTVTTLLGLQNIIPCKGVIEEIDRIAKVFFNISAYLTEMLPENMAVLNKFHIADVWVKEQFEAATERLGWQRKQICTIMELARGISREEMETRFAVMKFPVKDEKTEYTLTKFLMGCKEETYP